MKKFIIALLVSLISVSVNAKDIAWEDFRVIVDGETLTLDEAGFDELDLAKSLKITIANKDAEIAKLTKELKDLAREKHINPVPKVTKKKVVKKKKWIVPPNSDVNVVNMIIRCNMYVNAMVFDSNRGKIEDFLTSQLREMGVGRTQEVQIRTKMRKIIKASGVTFSEQMDFLIKDCKALGIQVK